MHNNQAKDMQINNAIKRQYKNVLQPLTIKHAHLPNRIVFPAIHTNYANTDGTVSAKLCDFYTNIAAGGCGLIFAGSAVVSKDTVSSNRIMRADSDNCIKGLKCLSSKINKYGSILGIQLAHSGRQALKSVTGYDLLAPSTIPCPIASAIDPTYKVKEMTLEGIERVQNDFVAAAKRAAAAGIKVVELHAAHGYLLAEFLSPYANYRTDQYGGSAINRCRIILEIIKKIRKQLRNQIVISIRVSGNEFVEGGLTPNDYQDIIPLFETAGMDMLNVSVGVATSIDHIIPRATLGEAPFVNIAQTLKQIAAVPVCTVGAISSLESAETILSSNTADLVAIGRAQIADQDLIKKTLTDNKDQIKKCLRCNKCLHWSTGDNVLRCTVNSRL